MKAIKLEQWQLENATMRAKGSRKNGKFTFNGSYNDFSEKIDLRTEKKQNVKEEKPRPAKKKKGYPTVFQYLKNGGFNRTYITIPVENSRFKSAKNDTQVIILEKFKFLNEVKKLFPTFVQVYYENSNEEQFSSAFFPESKQGGR
jgi:hypothetical protein